MPDAQQKQPTQSLLTTMQEHYLKKYLFGVLLNKELDRLQKNPYETLPNLGGPFDLKDEHANSTTPFLRYLFESIVVPFPFLTSSKGALWPKLQHFMEEWSKIEASSGVEREEIIRRKRIKNKGERTMVLMYSLAIKTVEQRAKEKQDMILRRQRMKDDKQQQQENGHVGDTSVQRRMDQIKLNDDVRDNKHLRVDGEPSGLQHHPSQSRSRSNSPSMFTSTIHGVRINVVGVRLVKEKKHVREHEHAEFIISSTFADGQEFVVARRHGRFRKLYHMLRREFPKQDFPVLPSKYAPKRSSEARTAHEKDRISLRGYLHNLAKVSQKVVDSSAFVNFLTQDAIALTEEEAKDIQARVALDEHRMAQQAKFDREVAKKVDELDEQLKEVKLDLLQPGGVSRLFSALKEIDNVNDLPPLYQTVFEWGCMSLASTLYHVFTSSDDATLNFTQLKRTHMLLPYRAMWGILKISNPMAMMKGIMDLFLAQPFGSRSLMQRIISGNMQEEVSEYKREISDIEAAIEDPLLCEKIRNYVYAPRSVINQIFANDEPYDITEWSLVMDVLRSDQIQPSLDQQQIKRVYDAQQKLDQERLEKDRLRQLRQQSVANDSSSERSSACSSESDSSRSSVDMTDNSSNSAQGRNKHNHYHQEPEPEANLIRQLQQLLVAHLRIRDKERIMGLVFQGVTGDILKEIITIFYEPLVKVYKSANIADSLIDARDFADELIKVVEQADKTDNAKDGASGKPTAASLYLNLVRKHLPSFYKFVHGVHKQDDGIFHDLLGWIESLITFMRTGYCHARIDYKTGEELRVGIDLDAFVKQTIDTSDWEQLQREAEALRVYFTDVKSRKRDRVRQMASLDRAATTTASPDLKSGSLFSDESDEESGGSEQERRRMSRELRGMGLQDEDVEDLEMINWDSKTDGKEEEAEGEVADGEMGLKVPKVPMIDTLQEPFVRLMGEMVFRTARE
ncbi:MAG: hypothetical protein J3Q66DRAFT_84238 [Benniella sp.]|nr:MAG: hypothetical protein J3Q66DRAFT_84238 [Benniella sp.]